MPGTQRPALSEHYARLGLPEGARREEVELACQEIEGFLTPARVPPILKGWASRQRRLAGEARDALQVALPSRRTGTAGNGKMGPELAARHRRRLPRRKTRPVGWLDRARLALEGRGQLVLLVALVGLTLLVALLVSQRVLPGRSAAPTPAAANSDSSSQQFVPLDAARVRVLQARVEQDASDTEALFELGERYFEADMWQESIDWLTRLLAVDPNHIPARTDVGTAHFNLGRYDQARATWTEALALAPDDPQLHWNIGFLYLHGPNPDPAAAKREWELVAKLAAGNELGAYAQRTLDELKRQETQPLAPR